MEGHVVLFPFMSKGHTIPILHLARLLCRRRISVTVFTTPANRPFIARTIANTSAAILDLPFPQNVEGVPAGVESTDQLPTISLYVPFATATAAMQPHFERALQNLPDVTFMVSDGFLWWTQESADKFNFPRLVFYGMGGYAMTVSRSLGVHGTLRDAESEHELLTVPDFPWIKVTRSDFDPPFTEREPKGPHFELMMKQITASGKSFGMIFNSFYELEPAFADFWIHRCDSRGWWVGPLCLADPPKPKTEAEQKPWWAQWLDDKSEQGRSVMYVAFGSQAGISPEQLKEIAVALEKSEVSFMWVIRSKECEELVEGFEERVKERGVVVREWVDQREILLHRSVKGFMSHCGWNSVMESVCAGVPILAWPMMAEQPLNAKMVVEEIKVGLRVETGGGGLVKWEGLEKKVRELMEGEMGEKVRKTVTEYSEGARKAMEEGGSSWRALESLIHDTTCMKKEMDKNGPVAADVDHAIMQ